MHTGPALWGPKIARRFFFSTRPPNQPRTDFVSIHFSLPWIELACTQIKERFLSLNPVAMPFGILFPSILLSASDDDFVRSSQITSKTARHWYFVSFP